MKYLSLLLIFFTPHIILGCSDICDKGGGICIWDFARNNAQPALGSCSIWNLLHTTKSFFSSASYRFFIQQRTCVSGKKIVLDHPDQGKLFQLEKATLILCKAGKFAFCKPAKHFKANIHARLAVNRAIVFSVYLTPACTEMDGRRFYLKSNLFCHVVLLRTKGV